MTLVLAVSTPAYTLHVSDRLVSRAGSPHDRLANKSVVFRAPDGVLAFGYTGPALIEGLPTDTWIADALSGGSCSGDIGAMAYGKFPVRDVGSSLLALAARLRGQAPFRTYGGEISGVGWQWKRGRQRALVRNVLWNLRREPSELKWRQLVPRHLPERKRTFRMLAAGDWPLGAEDWQQLLDRVGTAGGDSALVENWLVEAIREAGIRRPGTIGRHCMSIQLRPWVHPQAQVRFIPGTAHHGSALGATVEVAYSPWMVAPDAIHAPAVLVGGMSSEQGLLTYSMAAPPVPEGQRLKAAFQSQDRPRG